MRKFAHVTASLAMIGLAAGCASTKTTSSYSSIAVDFTAVGVRFVVPPMPKSMDPTLAGTGSSFVSDSNYSGFVPVADLAGEDISHVALWGGGFNGHDVTYASTALQPGMYTFAYMNPDKDEAVQGWMDVNPGGTEILDFLMRWYNNIPQMREALAYELELAGGTKVRNMGIFEGFVTQLRAFDRLEIQLAQAIANERQAQADTTWRYNEFLRNAEILMLPSETGFFHPTTQPAVTAAELASVEAGQTITKVVMLADADSTLWKLKRVNQVYNELNRCKTVLMEEADRLQRRKRFYTLTDHIYHHDRLFVHNELRLQQTFAAIDQLNENVAELRDRRMALAFVSELTAPDGKFRTLDGEEADLNREKTVLQAKMNQINHLFDEAKENSAKRVILERNRQEVTRAVEAIDMQLDQVDQARVALKTMNNNTEIIHRQGNWRLMTASLTGQDIPFALRKAIEQEALMTVRLEPTKTMFVPSNTRMTAMPPMITPDYTTYTYHNINGNVQLVVETSYGSVTTASDDFIYTYSTNPNSTTTVTTTASHPTRVATVKSTPSSQTTTVHHATSNRSNRSYQANPPAKQTSHTPSRTKTVAQKDNKDKKDKGNCNVKCPFFKLLAPPCWFEKD